MSIIDEYIEKGSCNKNWQDLKFKGKNPNFGRTCSPEIEKEMKRRQRGEGGIKESLSHRARKEDGRGCNTIEGNQQNGSTRDHQTSK